MTDFTYRLLFQMSPGTKAIRGMETNHWFKPFMQVYSTSSLPNVVHWNHSHCHLTWRLCCMPGSQIDKEKSPVCVPRKTFQFCVYYFAFSISPWCSLMDMAMTAFNFQLMTQIVVYNCTDSLLQVHRNTPKVMRLSRSDNVSTRPKVVNKCRQARPVSISKILSILSMYFNTFF